MTKGLTVRQESILHYIVDCIRDSGYPPTIAEIGEHFGIASTNGVNDHLVALERKGYIERSSKARSIYVTEKAEAGLYEHIAGALPLVGRVAAGYPLLAEENIESRVAVAASLMKPGAFCLRVQGDSMIEDGILDGDTIIVDPTRRPRKGDVVVALIEDEATVKRFHPAGDKIELRPANSTMQPLVYPASAVSIQGVVVSLQRTIR